MAARKVNKKLELIVHGYCRRICDNIFIKGVIDLCVEYCNNFDSFDPNHSYQKMVISEDDIIFNDGYECWATIFGLMVIKKNEIFSWNFETIGKPEHITNYLKTEFGVAEKDYEKETNGAETFLSHRYKHNYGLAGCGPDSENQFGNFEGDKMKMTLDLKKYTLSFDINGVENVTTISVDKNKEYKMAISMCKGRKLKLVSSGFEH